jgi:nanoRNase/pAp phosphatase (c-di-AMP/oligoRNAs hydrolase)
MRLITRADFDGIVCGVLVSRMEKIDNVLFVEPKYMQDGEVPVFQGDIITNLPYNPNCTLWFDHHWTNEIGTDFKGNFRLAPSAARVVYEYYGENKLSQYSELVDSADKIDSASLSKDDVINPKGYVLISMTIFPTPSNEKYNLDMINWLREKSAEEVLQIPEVSEKAQRVINEIKMATQQIITYSNLDKNVIVTDIRDVDKFYDGNRFLIYTLFPAGNVSMKIMDFKEKPNTIKISVGKSIFNKTCNVNVGELMAKYGGGGHVGAGSCRVSVNEADKIISEVIKVLNENKSDE